MKFKVGDLVSRESYNHDVVFKVVEIDEEGIYHLKGVHVRLCADCEESDLKSTTIDEEEKEESEFLDRIRNTGKLDRSDYFYLPGKILHIDGDPEYLNRCLKYYDDFDIWSVGVVEKETEVPRRMRELLEEYNPNIVVITGHDAYYRRKGKIDDLGAYKNSINFVSAVKEARRYEKSHDKLIIIAGACQSDYEELIKAGANFASSPKRINIHALDPAIIATKMSMSVVTDDIDLKGILEQTKYGKDGVGGVQTKGTMYIGYPR